LEGKLNPSNQEIARIQAGGPAPSGDRLRSKQRWRAAEVGSGKGIKV